MNIVNGPVVELVCEGACNPHRIEIEADVQRTQEYRRLRTLRHTPHVLIQLIPVGDAREHRYCCTQCGCERRCGLTTGFIPEGV